MSSSVKSALWGNAEGRDAAFVWSSTGGFIQVLFQRRPWTKSQREQGFIWARQEAGFNIRANHLRTRGRSKGEGPMGYKGLT